jgi:hypothetical protein
LENNNQIICTLLLTSLGRSNKEGLGRGVHIASMEIKIHFKKWFNSLHGRDHLGEFHIERRIILK